MFPIVGIAALLVIAVFGPAKAQISTPIIVMGDSFGMGVGPSLKADRMFAQTTPIPDHYSHPVPKHSIFVISMGYNEKPSDSSLENRVKTLLDATQRLLPVAIVWMGPPCSTDPVRQAALVKIDAALMRYTYEWADRVKPRHFTYIKLVESDTGCSGLGRAKDMNTFSEAGNYSTAAKVRFVLKPLIP